MTEDDRQITYPVDYCPRCEAKTETKVLHLASSIEYYCAVCGYVHDWEIEDE